jgi:hypothetical protein
LIDSLSQSEHIFNNYYNDTPSEAIVREPAISLPLSRFAVFSKFGTLYLGLLKYINTDIQIVRLGLVGDPLEVGYKSGGNRF